MITGGIMPVKSFSLALLIALSVLGGVGHPLKSTAALTKAGIQVGTVAMNELEVTIRPAGFEGGNWKFEVAVHNAGHRPIFAMIGPVRADRSSGPYIALGPNGTLEVATRLYPPPIYTLYSNGSGVELTRVDPNATVSKALSLAFPVKETIPPYGDTPKNRRLVDRASVKSIRACVGVIPDDEGVRDLLDRKRSRFVYGLERLMRGSFKGKNLLELQTVITSPAVEL
jgi:hypothetical protein